MHHIQLTNESENPYNIWIIQFQAILNNGIIMIIFRMFNTLPVRGAFASPYSAEHTHALTCQALHSLFNLKLIHSLFGPWLCLLRKSTQASDCS